jgi:hypothetical protein
LILINPLNLHLSLFFQSSIFNPRPLSLFFNRQSTIANRQSKMAAFFNDNSKRPALYHMFFSQHLQRNLIFLSNTPIDASTHKWAVSKRVIFTWQIFFDVSGKGILIAIGAFRNLGIFLIEGVKRGWI